jgi:hypothetical protein
VGYGKEHAAAAATPVASAPSLLLVADSSDDAAAQGDERISLLSSACVDVKDEAFGIVSGRVVTNKLSHMRERT